MKDTKTYVSIDLCNDYTQMAYYVTNDMEEPLSLTTTKNDQRYLVPTAVSKKNDSDEWLAGNDASNNKLAGYTYINNIVDKVLRGENVSAGNNNYSGDFLLKKFLITLIDKATKAYQIKSIDYIVVTVENTDRILSDLLRGILEEYGIDKNHIKVIGHSESLIYYMVFQKRELWVNDVIIFDFTKDQFLMRRLQTMRVRRPWPVIVEEKDLSDKFNYEMLETDEGKQRADEEFLKFVSDFCSKNIVSSVFFTGIGFNGKWMEKTVKYLCTKRRVFKGLNLFVKGAAFAAMSINGMGNADEYQFVCSGRTLVDINLQVNKDGKDVSVVLSKAGTNWYDAGARAEGILDNVNSVNIEIDSSISKKKEIVTLDLKDFPERPNKTTRIEVLLSYRSDRRLVIIAQDMGFGDFYKSSGAQVKKEINVEDYL